MKAKRFEKLCRSCGMTRAEIKATREEVAKNSQERGVKHSLPWMTGCQRYSLMWWYVSKDRILDIIFGSNAVESDLVKKTGIELHKRSGRLPEMVPLTLCRSLFPFKLHVGDFYLRFCAPLEYGGCPMCFICLRDGGYKARKAAARKVAATAKAAGIFAYRCDDEVNIQLTNKGLKRLISLLPYLEGRKIQKTLRASKGKKVKE